MASNEEAYARSVEEIMNICMEAEARNPNPANPTIQSVKLKSPAYRDHPFRRSGQAAAIPIARRLPCPRCGAEGKDVVEHKHLVAGCRMDGDAYGSDFTWCNSCGLVNYVSWDDR